MLRRLDVSISPLECKRFDIHMPLKAHSLFSFEVARGRWWKLLAAGQVFFRWVLREPRSTR